MQRSGGRLAQGRGDGRQAIVVGIQGARGSGAHWGDGRAADGGSPLPGAGSYRLTRADCDIFRNFVN